METQKEVMSKALTKFFNDNAFKDFCEYFELSTVNPLEAITNEFSDPFNGKKDLLMRLQRFFLIRLFENPETTLGEALAVRVLFCDLNHELGYPIPELTEETLIQELKKHSVTIKDLSGI